MKRSRAVAVVCIAAIGAVLAVVGTKRPEGLGADSAKTDRDSTTDSCPKQLFEREDPAMFPVVPEKGEIPESGKLMLSEIVGKQESYSIGYCVGSLFPDLTHPVEYERNADFTTIRFLGLETGIPGTFFGPDVTITVENATGKIVRDDDVRRFSDSELMSIALSRLWDKPPGGGKWVPSTIRVVSRYAFVAFRVADDEGTVVPGSWGFGAWVDLKTGKPVDIHGCRRESGFPGNADSPSNAVESAPVSDDAKSQDSIPVERLRSTSPEEPSLRQGRPLSDDEAVDLVFSELGISPKLKDSWSKTGKDGIELRAVDPENSWHRHCRTGSRSPARHRPCRMPSGRARRLFRSSHDRHENGYHDHRGKKRTVI